MIPKSKAWIVKVYWSESDRKDVTVYEAYGPTKLFAWWNARKRAMRDSLNNDGRQWTNKRVTISVKRERNAVKFTSH